MKKILKTIVSCIFLVIIIVGSNAVALLLPPKDYTGKTVKAQYFGTKPIKNIDGYVLLEAYQFFSASDSTVGLKKLLFIKDSASYVADKKMDSISPPYYTLTETFKSGVYTCCNYSGYNKDIFYVGTIERMGANHKTVGTQGVESGKTTQWFYAYAKGKTGTTKIQLQKPFSIGNTVIWKNKPEANGEPVKATVIHF